MVNNYLYKQTQQVLIISVIASVLCSQLTILLAKSFFPINFNGSLIGIVSGIIQIILYCLIFICLSVFVIKILLKLFKIKTSSAVV